MSSPTKSIAEPAYYFGDTPLVCRGFTFDKDGDDGEPDVHYVVVLGDSPTIEDAKRFVAAFSKETFTEETG